MAVGHMLTTGGSWAGRAPWLVIPPDQVELGNRGFSQKQQKVQGAEQNYWANATITIFHFRWVECCKVYEGKAFVSKWKSLGLGCDCGKMQNKFWKEWVQDAGGDRNSILMITVSELRKF